MKWWEALALFLVGLAGVFGTVVMLAYVMWLVWP